MPHLLRLQTACLILGCLALPEWSAAQSITYGQAVYGAVVYSQSVPGSATITDVAVADSEATVTFTPPTDTGGGVITGYTVTATSGGVSTAFTCTTSPCVLTGLSNGTAYSFTMTANNAAGASAVTAAADTATPAAAPDAPTQVIATAGDAEAVVNWTAPPDNGATISSYTVTAVEDGSKTCLSNAAPVATLCTVTGLSNGSAYSFTVTATNSAGTSPASAASNSVTPAAAGVDTPIPVMPLYALITMTLMLLLGALRRLNHAP